MHSERTGRGPSENQEMFDLCHPFAVVERSIKKRSHRTYLCARPTLFAATGLGVVYTVTVAVAVTVTVTVPETVRAGVSLLIRLFRPRVRVRR